MELTIAKIFITIYQNENFGMDVWLQYFFIIFFLKNMEFI
jgi:hypothetical protein